MNIKIIFKLTSVLAISSLFFISSCKKDDDTPANSTSNNQTLSLNINNVVGNKAVDFSSSFTTEAGARYTFTSLRYYVSNIRLIKADGSELPLTGKVLLVNPATPTYELGSVSAGSYKGLTFSVGLDSALNHSDPTVYATSNPLSMQSPAIHWSWNSGYIFMMMEGSVDTTANNTDILTYGQYSHSMFFHIGMDMLLRKVTFNSAFTVSANEPKKLNIQADINKLYKGIDIKKDNASHTMGSVSLATKVADNISTLFTIVP